MIALRTQSGVHELVPGLTGWAQVNGRDELPIPYKVKLDAAYLQRQSPGDDCLGAQAHQGILAVAGSGQSDEAKCLHNAATDSRNNLEVPP